MATKSYIPPRSRLVDFDGFNTYIGEAAVGSKTNEPVWRIKQVREYLNDPDMKIIWGDDSAEFDKVWDLRSSYAYG